MANFNVARSALRRSRGQCTYTGALSLIRGQGGGYDFIAVGESNLAGRHLADLAGQAVINFIADDQEAEQWTFRLGTEINRLHESFVEMVSAKPPVAGVLFIQRSLEVLLRRFAS